MAKTRQISVTNATPTAIACFAPGARNIRMMENRGVANWPTTDLLVMKPSASDTPVRIPAGSSYNFMAGGEGSGGFGGGSGISSFFQAGQPVGYVQTVTGTTTLDLDEDSA